eukprot:c9649_g1_i5.p1 GENE.c9649_g1_i5~~c9649_g1_i5.p1  ORF type:complete len:435 (-),score=41.52 c9649_g1_i5:51-1355(-)
MSENNMSVRLLEGGEESLPQRQMKGTVMGSIFNLSNTILGSGTLCLPFAAASSGWLLSNIVMAIVFFVTWYSVNILIRACEMAGPRVAKNYESLGMFTMGPVGARVTEFTFIFGGFGTLVSYLVFCTHLLASVSKISSQYHWAITLTLSATVVLPLSLFRSIEALRYFSLLAVASILFLVVFVLVVGLTDNDYQPEPEHDQHMSMLHISSKFIFTLTLLIGAFCCHNTTLPIYEELQHRTPQRMSWIVFVSLFVSFSLYEVIAMSGYAVFKNSTQDNVLLNFDENFLKKYPSLEIPSKMASISMAIALLFSAPVAFWPFRSCLLSVYLRWKYGKPLPSDHASTLQLRVISTLAVCLTTACAILTPNVRTPLSIVNSVAGSLIIFILPALFYLTQLKTPIWEWCNFGVLLLLFAGLLLAPFSLSLSIYEIVRSQS